MEQESCGSRIIHLEKVLGARGRALPVAEIEGLSHVFKAFADPSRLRILHALREEEMCVCDLSALLEISESAVSHQLRLLRTMRLVTNRRDGTVTLLPPAGCPCHRIDRSGPHTSARGLIWPAGPARTIECINTLKEQELYVYYGIVFRFSYRS